MPAATNGRRGFLDGASAESGRGRQAGVSTAWENPFDDGVVPVPGNVAGEGNALGLEDHRSKCLEEAWGILTLLSERQARPPGYTFEMVDARNHPSAKAREGFATFVQMAIGDSEGFLAVDAAKLGSPAHRVRVFCTNLAPVKGIRERYAAYDREWAMDRKEAQDCLDSGRMVNTARFNDLRLGRSTQ
jgi:hypothetical protein